MTVAQDTNISTPTETVAGSGIRILPVSTDQSGHWLRAAWQDIKAAPAVSLAYGGLFVIAGYGLVLGLFQIGMAYLVLPLMAGFLLIAPILAVGLYDVSRRLENQEPVTLGASLMSWRRNASQIALLGGILMLFFLAWIRVAMLLFALFFTADMPTLDTLVKETFFSPNAVAFLIVGTLTGAAFATVAFATAVVSIPLLLERRVDAITAVIVSMRVTRANWRVLLGWAGVIVVLTAVGMALFFLGLALVMPLLGHASWHAYRSLVDTSNATAEIAD